MPRSGRCADSSQTWMNELFYQVPVQEWTLLEDAGSPSAAGGSNTLVHTWLQNYSMQAGGATDNDLIEFHAAMLGRNLCVSANAFAQPFKGKDEPTQRKSLGACLKFVEVNQRQALYMVDEQVARHRREIGARLAQHQGPLLRLGRQQAHKRVLSQVGCMIGAP